MKTCPRCGVENKPEKAACWNCWAPLEGPAGLAPQPAPARRRLSLTVPWTAVAVVAVVAAAAAGTYYFLLSTRPADVVVEYLDAVKNGNEEKRDRLATEDTAGQSPLPAVLRIADYEVERDAVSVQGKQAQVPTRVELIVDPLTIGLERALLADRVMAHLKKGPVRANMVLVKQGLNWRVDQQQTQSALVESVVRDMAPGLKNQLMGTWRRGGERPRPAPPRGADRPGAGAPDAPERAPRASEA